ncbi:MAG: beta-ketoacyl-[acyl-carrier-protein] synthase family protein [Phycisphaeraceae bacterium JB051]
MSRRVVITGLGPVSALGIGIDETWQALLEGKSAVSRVDRFDPSGFPSQIAGQVPDFKVVKFVPKSDRKATKVMARDIELAVVGADSAARDAGLVTRSTDPDGYKSDDFKPSYASRRMGCHIGAGLIAADLEELTQAFVQAVKADGSFDIHKWGEEGMNNLTPLWLLKYLPNMLACHVTILHATQGPSNTITCAEASSELSIGESLRVIQRNAADACLSGGADSKLNPLGFLRQIMTGRTSTTGNESPTTAVRPFATDAAGTAAAEGGAIVILEALETYQARGGEGAYAEIVGFGASQTVNREKGHIKADPTGSGVTNAVRAALAEAQITADQVDLILPFGTGSPDADASEIAGLKAIFGERLADIPLVSTKAYAGNAGAGGGAIDVCVAAKAIKEQTIPARINCDSPVEGVNAKTSPSTKADLNYVLTYSTSFGGQNAALLLKKCD